jgi:hypothetical protein
MRWARQLGCLVLLLVASPACVVVLGGLFYLGNPFDIWFGERRRVIWQLPPDYRGWVVLEYGVPSCPPLPVRGEYQVVRVDASGRACTSDPRMSKPGPLDYQYEYVYPDGTRAPAALRINQSPGVWDVGGYSTCGSRVTDEDFFVGTEQEFQQSQPRPRTRTCEDR